MIQRYENYVQNIDSGLREPILQLIKALKAKNHLDHLKQQELKRINRELPERIRKESPYLSKESFWMHHQLKMELKSKTRMIKEKYHHHFIQELEKMGIRELKALYHFSRRLFQGYKRVKEFYLEMALKLQTPLKFNIVETYLPPYEVVKTQDKKPRYLFNYQRKIVVESNCCFWKVKYLMIEWFYFTKNLAQWCYFNLLFSEIGLKGLFTCQEYYIDYSINPSTGEITKDSN